ncbi:MAG: lytic transglycosylase domain-containing protein [Rickettsiales bacterium]
MGEYSVEAVAPEVSDSLRDDKRAIRAGLLVELGRMDDAETELRALYSATPEGHRGGIVTLVSELDMPNLQMRLARTKGLSESEEIFAEYPTPYYMVNLHEVMDSALLMAVARNESGFRDVARSSAGATGMMQMLPSTAKMVERQVGHERLQLASASDNISSLAKRLNDPSMSARYGAEYLNILANLPAINNNLIHLLVGYNAGPGTVISWKAASHNIKDPLLYIESIPYAETRNYVMQVSAQYWIYQIMMEEKPASLTALAKGMWPVVTRPPV